MNSPVRVVFDDSGTIIHQSKNNPEYGYIRLEQDRTIIDDTSGFLRRKLVSTLLHGTIEDLKLTNFKAGDILPGTIKIEERLEPFNLKDPAREIKRAGKTGIILTKDGKPIYRRTIYNPDPLVKDVPVVHDNKEELQAAYAELKDKETKSVIEESTDNFDLEV